MLTPQEFAPSAGATLAAVLGVEERLAAFQRMDAGTPTSSDVEIAGEEWDIGERAVATLARFGLGHLPLDRPLGAVSGGEGTRVALARLELGRPDFLILDEPPNHLDTGSRASLAFVEEWGGGLLCVSHDRELRRRMDRIVELSALGLRTYGGNYDFYRARRDEDDAAAARELDSARAALKLAGARRASREGAAFLAAPFFAGAAFFGAGAFFAGAAAFLAGAVGQARREAQGKRDRATANMPKILLNTRRGQGCNRALPGEGRTRSVAFREGSGSPPPPSPRSERKGVWVPEARLKPWRRPVPRGRLAQWRARATLARQVVDPTPWATGGSFETSQRGRCYRLSVVRDTFAA